MEEYEEDAVFQHSLKEFFGAVIKVQPFGQLLNAWHRTASSIRMIFVSGVSATRRQWIEIALMMVMAVRLQQCDGSRSGQFKEL